MSSEKRSQVLEAAAAVFMRYGFKRTTMSDIAEEAGISRQGLYGLFANKQDIFRGVVALFKDKAMAEIGGTLPQLGCLFAKLEYALEIAFARPFELAAQSPHADELFESSHTLGADVIRESYDEVGALLASIIESEPVELEPLEVTPRQLADILTASARGMKQHARDAAELRQMFAGLVRLTTVATQPGNPQAFRPAPTERGEP